MLSFWENQSFTNYDYAIVGSGIVGLSTAISLKEKKPTARVVVLEKGLLPTGASTKNAGFACFGSLTELLDDLKAMSEQEVVSLVEERYEGLEKLRTRLGDKAIDYKSHGGYELIDSKDKGCLEFIEPVNKMLSALFNKPAFEIQNEKIKTFGFDEKSLAGLVYNQYEGQIDTGKMMKSLLAYARSLDVEIITGAEVSELNDNGKSVKLKLNESRNDTFEITANKVACCTNAFTNKLVEDLDLKPGRGIVLVTKPIDNLKFKGVFHSDKGYYYFRNYENRVIFGGGRNIDFKAEETTEFRINEEILSALKQELDTKILPTTSYEIEQTWAGIMAFGENKKPILKKHSENIALGVRLGGMGVAIGSRMGEQLSEMVV